MRKLIPRAVVYVEKKRVSFCNQTKSIQVSLDELVNVSGLQKRLQKCEEDKKELEEQVQDLETRCEVLLQEIVDGQTKVKNLEDDVKKLEVHVKNLKGDVTSLEGVTERERKQNRELSAYLDHLEDNLVCINCTDILKNRGHQLHEVGKRQRNRKIKELKTRAERALWFLETFGLALESIQMKDVNGKLTSMECGSNNDRLSFQKLPEDEKDTVRALLYILDKFSVGDAAYHEISMIDDQFPRSYLNKQCRNDLNSIFHIARTPGKHPGAQMSFTDELRRQIRKKVIFINK